MTDKITNTETRDAIFETRSGMLAREIDEMLDFWNRQDEPMSVFEALCEVADIAEYNQQRMLLKFARRALIKVGAYREVTRDEMSRTITNSGRVYDVKLDGKYYVWTARAGARVESIYDGLK